MAPRLERVAGHISSLIRRDRGPDSAFVEELRIEAERALKGGDYGALQDLTGQLVKSRDLDQRLKEYEKGHKLLLENLDLSREFVSYSALEALEIVSETEQVGKPPSEHAPQRNPEKYVDHAPAIILLRLIERAPPKTGRYVYETNMDVGIAALKPNLRNNGKALREAASRIGNVRDRMKKSLLKDAKSSGSKTVAEIVQWRYKQAENKGKEIIEKWKEFYDYADENYGELTVQDFIKDIMHGKRKVSKRKSRRELRPKREAGIKPKEIMNEPAYEMILSGILRREGILDNINELIGKDIVAITDHEDRNQLFAEIEGSCMEAFKKRGGRNISNDEQKLLNPNVRNAIRAMANNSSRRSWHHVKKDFLSWKVIWEVTGHIAGDEKSIDGLIDILCSGKKVEADGSKSFFGSKIS